LLPHVIGPSYSAPLSPVFPIFTGSNNVACLRGLRSSKQQQYDIIAGQCIVDTISSAYIDPQFPHTISAISMIAKVASCQAIYTPANAHLGFSVTKVIEPLADLIAACARRVVSDSIIHFC